MDVPHRAWTLLTTTTLGQIVLFVTLLVGLFSIFKDVWKLGLSIYEHLRSFLNWHRDREVLHFIRTTHPQKYYEVSEIATALGRKKRKISQSLQRLRDKEKVRRYEVNEHSHGIWKWMNLTISLSRHQRLSGVRLRLWAAHELDG